MTYAFYAVLAALLWAVTNVIDKFVLSRLESRPHLPFIVQGLVGGTVGVGLLLVRGLQPVSLTEFVLLLVTSVAFLFLNLWYFKAADLVDMSQVIPLFYVSPALVAVLAALFLHETFSAHVYIGIGMIVLGAVLISIEKFGQSKVSRRAFLYIGGAVLADGVLAILLKTLLKNQDYWTVFTYIRLMAFVIMIPFIVRYWSEFDAVVRSRKRSLLGWSFVGESINIFAMLFGTIAIAGGFVTIASALEATQPFFVLLFTVLLSLFLPKIIKESVDRNTVLLKLVAIASIFVGIVGIR